MPASEISMHYNGTSKKVLSDSVDGRQKMNDMNNANTNAFAELMAVIVDRKANPPERSYTKSLFEGGIAGIGEKIIEEANEVVEAGSDPVDSRNQHVVSEAVDLIYHLFVLLGYFDISLPRIEGEMRRRFGVSGLDEKAARGALNE